MSSKMSNLETAELACMDQDAAEVRGFFLGLWRALTTPHDPKADPMEAAILAVQQQDLKALKLAAARVRAETQTPSQIKAFEGPMAA